MPKKSPSLFALVDCNNFYASCERLFRPDLRERPLVVLSNNDGCIVSRSREAKALGIPMGEPEFKARPFLKKHKVAVFSSNYALYGDISQRVMASIESLVPARQVEQYSIDEAFVRLDAALAVQAQDFAHALRQRIWQWTGIMVSVGIAPTRTLAKMANQMAKGGQGICCLGRDTEGPLRDFPLEEVWGIGRRQAAKCHARGLVSALDLQQADDLWLRRNLTVCGLQTALELRGIACIGMHTAPTPRKTLVSSRSFGRSITDKQALLEALSTFAARAAARLRRAKLVASGIAVHIRTSRHLEVGYLDRNTQVHFPQPTADTLLLIKAVEQGLDRLYAPGYAYAKAGVMLFGLEEVSRIQGNLLNCDQEAATRPRRELHAALDAINHRYGKNTLHYGAEGPAKADWHMRQRYLSPRSTTEWDELAQAKL